VRFRHDRRRPHRSGRRLLIRGSGSRGCSRHRPRQRALNRRTPSACRRRSSASDCALPGPAG
jgi:hypothetical protein